MQIRVCNVAFVAYIYKASVAYVLRVKPMWRDDYEACCPEHGDADYAQVEICVN